MASAGYSSAAVEAFEAGLRGRLLRPADAGYDEARTLYNGMIDHRPALIARCEGVADVRRAIAFGGETGLMISVRGGGHNVSGNALCDGGLMIDLSPMRGIRVDPAARRRAEPGVLWREFDDETQAFGLATTGGVVSSTGIAGLTLGGGLGWLMGSCGGANRSNSRRSAKPRAIETIVKIAPIAKASPRCAGRSNHGKTTSCVTTAMP